MKIATIVGARPQFVKACMVSRAIQGHHGVSEILIHTGQHFSNNMSDIFFDEMEIRKPDYNLGIQSLRHGQMTGQMLSACEDVFLAEKPNLVLVYGDTNSTLAGALAASKLGISIAHVEAGLRSFNRKMPEEINRILTDRLSTLLFCPSQAASENLQKEGGLQVYPFISVAGDVMYDAFLLFSQRALQEKEETYKNQFVLCTLHRQENTDDPRILSAIIEALNQLSDCINIIFPVHPRTLARIRGLTIQPRFPMISPVGYFAMLRLLHHCEFVVTDSGGLQKEAYFSDKICLTLREETEWIELMNHQVNALVPPSKIGAQPLIEKYNELSNQLFPTQLYGDGRSAEKIINEIVSFATPLVDKSLAQDFI